MILRYINIFLYFWNIYNKFRVDFLQNLFFVQSYFFFIAFFDSFFFEFFIRVYFFCRSYLICIDFFEFFFFQYFVYSKCVFCDWLIEKKNWFFKFKIYVNKKICIIFRIFYICNFYLSCVFFMFISFDKLWGRKYILSLKVYFLYFIIKL